MLKDVKKMNLHLFLYIYIYINKETMRDIEKKLEKIIANYAIGITVMDKIEENYGK